MTLEDVLARAAADLDNILEERRDAMAQQMIADGVDPTAPGDDDLSAAEGPWMRVSFSWVLQEQKHRDQQWRDATIADLRKKLMAWQGIRH